MTDDKLGSFEAMLREETLRLAQQKNILKQSHSLQIDQLCKTTKFSRRELKWLYTGWKVACTDGCGVSIEPMTGNECYG